MTDIEILDAMNPRDKELVLAFSESDMRLGLVAKEHYLSHQGVNYHFRKVKANTGLDPRNFFQLYRLATLIIQVRKEYDGTRP